MLAILLLAAEKHKATFIAPIGIGLALFVAELLGVYYTGGSLNPARSFGPDVVLGQFAGYRQSSPASRKTRLTNRLDLLARSRHGRNSCCGILQAPRRSFGHLTSLL